MRQFLARPKFWPRFLGAVSKLVSADVTVLLLGHPGKTPRWTKIGEMTASSGPLPRTALTARLEPIAERCLREASFVEENDSISGSFIIGIRLKLARAEEEVILAALVVDFTEAAPRESLVRLGLAADTPALYQLNLAARQAKNDVEKFAAVLDLLAPINEATRFLSAALALYGGVATRFRCDRAGLGWLEGGYIRLRAIGHGTIRPPDVRRSITRRRWCLDQDEEILWPAVEGANSVTRDHETFSQEQKSGNVCSVPLRLDRKVVAVLTCERQEAPFNTIELQQLRLICDQAVRRLGDLKSQDRWFGARWATTLANTLAGWGPNIRGAKFRPSASMLILAALFFIRVNYRVENIHFAQRRSGIFDRAV